MNNLLLLSRDSNALYLTGQTYSLRLSCEKPTEYSLLKSSISLEFHDLRLRNSEETQIQQWMNDNNGQRMLEMVAVSCSGVSNIQHHDDFINFASFVWASHEESVVSFKINALSSEFTAKKHGGEKGVPFRLVLNTYSIPSIEDTGGTHISKCFCLVKVFKDKGADRKHKHDLQKREKLQSDEAAKYWESSSVTKLQPVPLSAKSSEQQLPLQASYYSPTLQSSQSPSNATPSTYSLPPAPEFNSPPLFLN
ncbi:PREDICTED: upstream-binding protein 1-like [Amphimedon queenslandica]|uniref:Grh/CP2 DB domain-containing protein n=1 Tax=Amphimedon queenslandica TaxID=400682 RepID=A0AAN0IYW8_AMPQE|nr:PREDICTED: upstream-binding protein 1-like [Amphimedon queenslandica]|eukprot:XP_019849643.1 PREDICTED: upstream-binding protein 1-like [Amphimedon queenslandica]